MKRRRPMGGGLKAKGLVHNEGMSSENQKEDRVKGG